MTIKTFTVDHQLGYGQMNDVYGGQELRILASPELMAMIQWWKEWGPVFNDGSSTVQDALVQARVLHELGKEQSKHPHTYSWTETTL
jgi:hypothetical protein